MLFNSYAFIFAFLPFTLLGMVLVTRWSAGRSAPLMWLIGCSVLFYTVWNPINLLIIAPSLLVNYCLARWLRIKLNAPDGQERGATALLALGILFNLCFLGYFKYKNFFLESVNYIGGTDFPLLATILPLGISFITFQKIAFLVDVRSGAVKSFDGLDFLIFVFFFPQLIAGPIVHYREMVPQFQFLHKLSLRDLAIGLSLFAIGLFKKGVLADGIAPYASAIFETSERGQHLGLAQAWLGATAFMLQVYFDFSGYSDMAIGLGRVFGVRLPINFDSPLKARSIIDFWNRWHMTLTRFLTAYVYSPIILRLTRARMAAGKSVAGSRGSDATVFMLLIAMPTVFTMFLSGLWHGAGLTFVLYGLLHGAYLTVNHAWRQWRPRWDRARYERVMNPLGLLLTLAAAVFAMALFRSRTLAGAGHMMIALLGGDGVSLPAAVLGRLGALGDWLQSAGVTAELGSGAVLARGAAWCLVLLALAIKLPNSMESMGRFEPAQGAKARAPEPWLIDLNRRWAVILGLAFLLGVLSLNRVSEFLYWQF